MGNDCSSGDSLGTLRLSRQHHTHQSEGAVRQGFNPFSSTAQRNRLRRLRHIVIAERLYGNRPPSPEVLCEYVALLQAKRREEDSDNESDAAVSSGNRPKVHSGTFLGRADATYNTISSSVELQSTPASPLQAGGAGRLVSNPLLGPPATTTWTQSTSLQEPAKDAARSAGGTPHDITEVSSSSRDVPTSAGPPGAVPGAATKCDAGVDSVNSYDGPSGMTVTLQVLPTDAASPLGREGSLRRDGSLRQNPRGNPMVEQYISAQEEVRAALHIRGLLPPTFIVAVVPQGSQSSVHKTMHQLHQSSPLSTTAGALPTASSSAALLHRGLLPSILMNREGGECKDRFSGIELLGAQGSASASPTTQRRCSILRSLHVSPRCLGYLTDELQHKFTGGSSDNAHFDEITVFPRGE